MRYSLCRLKAIPVKINGTDLPFNGTTAASMTNRGCFNLKFKPMGCGKRSKGPRPPSQSVHAPGKAAAVRPLLSKIVFINRFFHPDYSATSQMLSDLAFALAADGFDVHVITSRLLYNEKEARLAEEELVRRGEGPPSPNLQVSAGVRNRHQIIDYLTFLRDLLLAHARTRAARRYGRCLKPTLRCYRCQRPCCRESSDFARSIGSRMPFPRLRGPLV